jgi:hypothetical protein
MEAIRGQKGTSRRGIEEQVKEGGGGGGSERMKKRALQLEKKR